MSCCTPSRSANAEERQGADADLPQRAATLPGPARVRFAATKSFVGTDNPAIAEDGEGPARPVRLHAFELETETVTNSRFAAFIAETGYVTEAERFGWSPVFIGLLPQGTPHIPTRGATPWWVRVDGAYWKAPEGPGSDLCGRSVHPVVQVSWNDAWAFARWSGGRLPTEAEWEHAARGGFADPRYPWGDDEPHDEAVYCNIWQGEFPHINTLADGHLGTNPVNTFAPNGAGLYDMSGNVWEWTADPFRIRSLSKAAKTRNAAAATQDEKTLKGGSFLCHKSYCYRYRIAARSALTAESSTSNVGFRVAYDV